MSSLPQQATDKAQGIADVNDDIPVYCIVGQGIKPNTILKKYEHKVVPSATTKVLVKAQASELLCQNLKVVRRKDETITANEDGLLCKKSAH